MQADSRLTLLVESLVFDDRLIMGYERQESRIALRKTAMNDEVGWMRNLEFEATSEMEI